MYGNRMTNPCPKSMYKAPQHKKRAEIKCKNMRQIGLHNYITMTKQGYESQSRFDLENKMVDV